MKIVPAILTDNLKDFKKYLNICRDFGTDEIQIDICDGKFTSSKTLSISEIKQVLEDYNIKLQFHLMVENVSKYLDELEAINPEVIYIHFEALNIDHNYSGKNIGLAINPETQVESIKDILSQFSSILIMTVKPGFYGGQFLEKNLIKIDELRKMGFKGRIGIDGGINLETLTKAIAQKPDFICSGSYLLNSEKPLDVWEKYQKVIY